MNQSIESKKLWFKRKRYGWGWMPVSWEGWLVLVVYLAGLAYFFSGANATQHSVSDVLINFAVPFIVLTLLLIAICYKKGEEPKWTWGR